MATKNMKSFSPTGWDRFEESDRARFEREGRHKDESDIAGGTSEREGG